jgi:uncharacterized coiled-coil protein SlyX
MNVEPLTRNAGLLAVVLVATFVAFFSPALAGDGDQRIEQLELRVAELEALLDEIKENGGAVDPARIEELERQIRILAEEIEDLEMADVVEPFEDIERGLGPSASKVYRTDRGVSVGGYGEMLYQNFDSKREDGAPSAKTDELDFLRAVLYFGYKFNDRIVFNSEIEYEHASTGRDGEVSVEFAYLDFLFRDAVNVRAGLVLLPLGFINELHEPPTFLGARRPYVETLLLPTTWRENGAGVYGQHGPVSYRAYVTNGLAAVGGTSSDAPGYDAKGIRNGRTKGSKSAAEDFALSARLDWQATDWLLLGGSLFTGDAGQGATTPAGEPIGADTTIWELHSEVRWRGLQARALYVGTEIEDVTEINLAQGFNGDESVGEEQYGWYGELGWDILSVVESSRQAVVPYLRYERYNTQDRVPAGFAANPANDVTVTTLGMAYRPIVNVALKLDYNWIENDARTGVKQFNIALGFMF